MNKYFECINIISATSVFVPWFVLSSFLVPVLLLFLAIPPFQCREARAPVAGLQITQPRLPKPTCAFTPTPLMIDPSDGPIIKA